MNDNYILDTTSLIERLARENRQSAIRQRIINPDEHRDPRWLTAVRELPHAARQAH